MANSGNNKRLLVIGGIVVGGIVGYTALKYMRRRQSDRHNKLNDIFKDDPKTGRKDKSGEQMFAEEVNKSLREIRSEAIKTLAKVKTYTEVDPQRIGYQFLKKTPEEKEELKSLFKEVKKNIHKLDNSIHKLRAHTGQSSDGSEDEGRHSDSNSRSDEHKHKHKDFEEKIEKELNELKKEIERIKGSDKKIADEKEPSLRTHLNVNHIIN